MSNNGLSDLSKFLEKSTEKETGSSEPDNKLQTALLAFLKEHPNPEDADLHKWAESKGYNVHEVEDQAYRLAGKYRNFLANGRSVKKKVNEKDVDPKELAMGIKVESEHIKDEATQKRIALDHLAEMPDYYSKLKVMEGGKDKVQKAEGEGYDPSIKKITPATPASSSKLRPVATQANRPVGGTLARPKAKAETPEPKNFVLHEPKAKTKVKGFHRVVKRRNQGVSPMSGRFAKGIGALGEFVKAGSQYIGPRGGKWADAAHTIPWKEEFGTGSKPSSGRKEETPVKKMSLGEAIHSQDYKAVKSAVDALVESAKVKGNKSKVLSELRSHLSTARDHAKTMVGRVEADSRRSTPVAGREKWTHAHLGNARSIRDYIDSARAKVAEQGKSDTTKKKQATSSINQSIEYRHKKLEDDLRDIKDRYSPDSKKEQGINPFMDASAANHARDRHQEIAHLHRQAGNHAKALEHEQKSKEAEEAFHAIRALQANKNRTKEDIEKVHNHLRGLVGMNPIEHSPAYHAEQAGQLTMFGVKTEKSLDGIGELEDFVKAGGMYIGPRGGKWADSAHTIPWKEEFGTGAKTSGEKKEEPSGESKGYTAKDVIDGKAPYKVGDSLSPKHDSAETAYVIDGYPYGRLRTQMRVWVDTGKPGQRIMQQTKNPKNGKWNKPHASTYSDALVMTFNEDGHITNDGINLAYSDHKELLEWIKKHGDQIAKLPKENQLRIRHVAKVRELQIGGMTAQEAIEATKEDRIKELAEVVKEESAAHKEKQAAKKEAKAQPPSGPAPKLPDKYVSAGLDLATMSAFTDANALRDHIGSKGYSDYFKGMELIQIYKKMAKAASAVNRNELATQYKHLASVVQHVKGFHSPGEKMSATAESSFSKLKQHVKKHGIDKGEDTNKSLSGKESNMEGSKSLSGIDALEDFVKAGAKFIGPRGGEWADAAHTIAYKEDEKAKARGKAGAKPSHDPEKADTEAVTEFKLHADNDQNLYNQRKAFEANVVKKMAAGTYDHAMAPKLWGYYAERVIDSYKKEHGTKDWKIDKHTKGALAQKFADEFHDKVKANPKDYAEHVPKKHAKDWGGEAKPKAGEGEKYYDKEGKEISLKEAKGISEHLKYTKEGKSVPYGEGGSSAVNTAKDIASNKKDIGGLHSSELDELHARGWVSRNANGNLILNKKGKEAAKHPQAHEHDKAALNALHDVHSGKRDTATLSSTEKQAMSDRGWARVSGTGNTILTKQGKEHAKRIKKSEEQLSPLDLLKSYVVKGVAAENELEDLEKTYTAIRNAYEKKFGAGSWDKIEVSKEAMDSKGKAEKLPFGSKKKLGPEEHERYTEAKKRLARKLGMKTEGWGLYGKTIMAGLKNKEKGKEETKKGAIMSKNFSAVEILEEIQKSEQSLPTGEPKQTMGTGSEQGGKLDGVGKATGAHEGPENKIGAVDTGKKEKLSEDDVEVEKQLEATDKKKALEQNSYKSMASPASQREMVAKEHAELVQKLRKGEDDVIVGVGIKKSMDKPAVTIESETWDQGKDSFVKYSNKSDLAIEHMLTKSDQYYIGPSPSITPMSLLVNAMVECPACSEKMHKSLTACPNCGAGSSAPEVAPANLVQLAKSDGGPVLRPNIVQDVIIKDKK